MENLEIRSTKTVFVKAILLTLPILAFAFSISAQKTSSQCLCTEIKILSSPRGEMKEGDIVEFSAGPPAYLQYVREFVWTISEGEIISGQGTPTIRVRARSMDRVVNELHTPPSSVVQIPPLPPGFV